MTIVKLILRVLLSLSLILLLSCNRPEAAQHVSGKRATNVILLIGDGMGLSQVSSSLFYGEGTPSFERFKQIGLIKTSSSRQRITDSAAGATAFACGVKTYNGAIGVDDDTLAVPTLIEMISFEGLRSGVIATSSITHATPASFYAHVYSRNEHEAIAEYLVHSGVDFFAGGGLEYFSKRKDGLNYLDSLEAAGFYVDTTELKPIQEKGKVGYLLAMDGMPKMTEGRGDFLPKSTEMALDYLNSDNKKGFFLMVEGSQIDWGGHANDGTYIVEEMKDFDKVIHKALDFAEKDGNTLVVVTADHETGGFSLVGKQRAIRRSYSDLDFGFSSGGHSATMVPVFAFGPGAEHFKGIYENNEIFDHLIKATEWDRWKLASKGE